MQLQAQLHVELAEIAEEMTVLASRPGCAAILPAEFTCVPDDPYLASVRVLNLAIAAGRAWLAAPRVAS